MSPWRWLARRRDREAALAQEIEFHVEQRVADLRATGLGEPEARRIVRLEFGGIEQVKEQCREARPAQWLETFAKDARYALRGMRRSPGFALTAIVTLALAIGANTAVFSLISFVLLEPLPYPEPERIAQFWFTTPDGNGLGLSVPELNALIRASDAFEDVAAYDFGGPGVNITGRGDPEQVPAIHVAAPYFRLLGARTVAGRPFTPDEDEPGGGRVVMLSQRLWERQFGGRANVVGQSISLGGEPYTVVGVIAASFRAQPAAEVWLPLQADPKSTSHAHYLHAIGRLRQGVSFERGNARLKLAFADYHRQFPLGNPEAGFAAKPLRETRSGEVRTALLVLLLTVGFVLLIACSNVANLLLARAAARQHELAMRVALGGSRRRIVSQLLTESGLLAVAGSLLGFAAGRACLELLLALSPDMVPGADATAMRLDWRVLAFTTAVAAGVTIFCGLVPAVRACRDGLASVIPNGGTRTGTGRGASRTGSFLVALEVALAVMLVVGAGLMIRTYSGLRSVDSGLDRQRILTLQMSLQGTRFQGTAAVSNLVDRSVQRLEGIPGVVAAASTWTLPVEVAFGSSFVIEGRALNNERVHGPTLMRPVSADYAKVFGIPIRRGRFFTARDTATSGSVAVISEAMARKYWPKSEAIGERIVLDKYIGPEFAAPPREIVGIVGDVRDAGLQKDPGPMVYVPQSQVPNGMTMIDARILPITWVVRTAQDPYSIRAEIQRELTAASGGLATGHIRSMEDVVRDSTARSDFNTVLLACFAGLALLLAAVGVHGMISFHAGQRLRELGIRAALGATPGQMRMMVVLHGLRLAAIGIVAGAAGSIALARSMESLLFGVKPVDPATIACGCGLLAVVAILAGLPSARRVGRLNVVEVLRAI